MSHKSLLACSLRPLLMGFALFASFFLGGFLLHSALATWSPPSIAAPGGNVKPPINVSPILQDKPGAVVLDAVATRFDAYLATISGNVGIGTTSPGAPLSFGKAISDKIYLYESGTNKFGFGIGSGELNIFAGQGGASFRTNGPSGGVAMYISQAGNVGIGTTRPGSRLSVNGGISAGTYSASAAPSGGMIISGNVGIGTTRPQSKLHIFDTNGGNILRIQAGTGVDQAKIAFTDNNAGETIIGRVGATAISLSAGAENAHLIFETISSGSLTEKMRIQGNGNVGIGTTGPNKKLDVTGAIHATGDICTDLGGGTGKCLSNAGGAIGPGTVNFVAKWITATTLGNSSVFDNGTSVGIGTTRPLASLKLQVAGAAGVQGDLLASGSATFGGLTTTLGGLVIEKRTSDPVSPEDAQIWLRTDVPPPAVASGKNFFLLSFGTYNGNLLGYARTNLGYTGTDGLQAADAICLSEVNGHGFIGKPAGKTYTQAEVYAFLCAGGCRNLLPDTAYIMGRLGSTHGGNTFTTNSSSKGPGDNHIWSDSITFDEAASYWMSRKLTTSPTSQTLWGLTGANASCGNWNTSSSQAAGYYGHSDQSDQFRWNLPAPVPCDFSYKLICAVDAN